MACFLVPTAEAVVSAAVGSRVKKAEKLEIAGETGDYDTIKKENSDFLLETPKQGAVPF